MTQRVYADDTQTRNLYKILHEKLACLTFLELT